jgi:DNA primase
MTDTQRDALRRQIPLLDYLGRRGWKPIRDRGKEEVAGVCPLHRETQPSFYVNRRKQLFYCHGCGRGGDVIRLVELLDGVSFTEALTRLQPSPPCLPVTEMLEETYRFYETQLGMHGEACAYLTQRGIHAASVVSQMRIGYAPGACLRAHLTHLGCSLQSLMDYGLVNAQGRDHFYGCLTFPLEETGNLYGRSLDQGGWRHRFLPRPKGGLHGWESTRGFSELIVVEGLFDLAALWQAGFPQAVAALGCHLHARQWTQLTAATGQRIYVCFDGDASGAGAAQQVCQRLRQAGVEAWPVRLPAASDPASWFSGGGDAGAFRRLLEEARQ